MSQLIKDMLEITRCGAQYRLDQLSPMGLKACHASYLTEICAQPGISQDQLAKLIFLNKSNVARQVVVLEDEGFITRSPSPADKRVMQLYPTQKALDLLPEISCLLTCWEECITGDLSDEEKEQVSSLLAKMKCRAARYMETRSE